MFYVMPSLITVLVFVIFGVTLFRMFSQWNKNNHSPRLTVPATVVAKRTNVTRHHHGVQTVTIITIPPPRTM